MKNRSRLSISCDFSFAIVLRQHRPPLWQASEYPHATATSAFRQICQGGGHAVARDRFQIRAHTCRPLFSSRPPDTRTIRKPENVLPFVPQYFDAKSIKPEKFRRTGKFRVGKNRGKGIFQQSKGSENLYNIRNCSYTKYLLSNICK